MHDFAAFGNIFFKKIFAPALDKVLKEADPKKYKEFAGNSCRQTAIFGSYFLEEAFPGLECIVWEGTFVEPLFNKGQPYVHAWIFIKYLGRKFFVDYSRRHKECLFIEVKCNRYPKDHPDYEEMKEVSRERIDWRELFNGTEWYSDKPSIELYKKISIEMHAIIDELGVEMMLWNLRQIISHAKQEN